jgi:hypothetical protein
VKEIESDLRMALLEQFCEKKSPPKIRLSSTCPECDAIGEEKALKNCDSLSIFKGISSTRSGADFLGGSVSFKF